MKNLYYPTYHFRPERNWMNDPNGLIYFKGKYHLFYQYNPNGDRWGSIHWGHAVSSDLIHWEELPIALYPSVGDGEIHCYSGCAVVKDGFPYLFYTSVGEGKRGPETGAQQWSAVSYDGMMSWKKEGKPAIQEAVHGNYKIKMWRDPFLWKEDYWYAVLGGTENNKGCLLLYRSYNLDAWECLGKIYESDRYWLVECPNMIPVGEGRYLILYSPLDAVRYMIARLNKDEWTLDIEKEGVFDHSILKRGFYAPNTYLNDPKGRIVSMGWISEADGLELSQTKGWAGMQSLPREIHMDKEGKLSIWPVEECCMLRKKSLFTSCRKGRENTAGSMFKNGRCLLAESWEAEIYLRVRNGLCGNIQISFLADGFGKEETNIILDSEAGQIRLDRSLSSQHSSPDKSDICCDWMPEKETELRMFIDHSSVEVFVDRVTTITARVYPKLEESCKIFISGNGEACVEEMNIWELGL
ncbi:glycoside hydrolase family 32 protein [Blautia schinkii]|nr:glycoside hydrolase family 32 protein [Blautia schinkii]